VVLATYSGYDAAEHAVDVLARHDFPFADEARRVLTDAREAAALR
jgi:hypothetical protein